MYSINNKTPFSFLDSYQDECFYLYAVVKSVLKYPPVVNHTEEENLEGLFYALGFFNICEDFLKITTRNVPYDDWDELVQLFEFEKDQAYIEQKWQDTIEYDTFSELIWEIVLIHQKRIQTDLKNTFKDRLPAFMGSIFEMNENGGYIPEYSLDLINYFDEF